MTTWHIFRSADAATAILSFPQGFIEIIVWQAAAEQLVIELGQRVADCWVYPQLWEAA